MQINLLLSLKVLTVEIEFLCQNKKMFYETTDSITPHW